MSLPIKFGQVIKHSPWNYRFQDSRRWHLIYNENNKYLYDERCEANACCDVREKRKESFYNGYVYTHIFLPSSDKRTAMINME